MITNTVYDIFTVFGTFERVSGELEKTEHGFKYKNSQIELISHVDRHSSGVNIRKDKIVNISNEPVNINTLLSKFTLNGGEYEVYTEYSEWINESMGEWQPLVNGIYGANEDIRANVGTNPFVALYNTQNSKGLAFHILAESTFEYRVKKQFVDSDHKSVTIELGISSDNFNYTLEAGKELNLPTILYYEFTNKIDLDAHKLHRYINATQPSKSLPVIYNSWMSNFDLMSYSMLVDQVEKAKEIGCEYFVVDAGWFGQPTKWWNVVGDWQESTKYSLKGDMDDLASKVRHNGMKFGLWFEIERASLDSKSYKKHPDYYIVEGEHAFVNFAKDEAVDYIFDILQKNIDKYGIEFIKFDFNARLSFDSTQASFIEYFKGYRKFIERVRRQNPGIHLENCASGGGRMALCNVWGFDSFWMSDNHGVYAQLDIFKNTLKRMPSRMLEKWITIRSIEEFSPVYPVGKECEKLLVSADNAWIHTEQVNFNFLKSFMVGGPIGVSCDLTKLSKSTLKLLKKEIEKFKEEREFWKNSECHILTDTKSLLVLQYCDKEFEKIKLYSYTKHSNQNTIIAYPVCKKGYTYVINGKKVSGAEILKNGIELKADGIYNADTVEMKRA
ncbi:MAG: alpha-galactosidase [Clostridia bacterium]|nr:alpha-galactosidase [Clostridia bacterium]